MKNKDEKKNPVFIPASYKIDSTLEELDALALAIPQAQEIEQKVEAINEIESLAEINKQQLAVRRQRIELEVENKKLDAGNNAMNAIGRLIDRVLEKSDEIELKTALDLKLYSESIERLANSVKLFMNSNIADEFGNKKRHKINFMFKSSGPVQAAVQIDTSDD